MVSSEKVVHLKTSNSFTLFFAPILLIGVFWILFIGLTHMGIPFPKLNMDKFLDLSFFSLSIFGIIIFLTMIPFQTSEGKLSPIFYGKMFNAPSAHMGIYVLIWSFIICFIVMAFQEVIDKDLYLSQLFIALVASIAFAILFHRFWVLRCLYQPYIVYKYIKTLEGDEPNQEIWLELYECTFKAIKQGRVSDANNFLDLMSGIYKKCSSEEKALILKEDLRSLYAVSQESRPVARFIEEKWPFCVQKK